MHRVEQAEFGPSGQESSVDVTHRASKEGRHGVLLKQLAVCALAVYLGMGASVSWAGESLPELLEAARTTHPSIRASQLGIDAAIEDHESARRRFYPTLSIAMETGSRGPTYAPSRYFRIEQNIWDGGATQAGVTVAQEAVSLAQEVRVEQSQSIEFQVIEAWQQLLSARGRLEATQRFIQKLGEHEGMMGRRVAGGMSTQVELQLVQAQLLQARVDLRKSRTNETLSLARLQVLTGRKALTLPGATMDIDDEPERLKELLRLDWEALVDLQPAVRKALAQQVVEQAQIKQRNAELMPQLYARVDRGIGRAGETTGYLGVRYALGSGGTQWAAVKAQVARAESARATYEAARMNLLEALLRGVRDLEETSERVQALQLAVESSERIHESYVRQFTASKKSWLDVMNAVRELSQNEYALNEAKSSYAGLLERLTLYAHPDKSLAP